MSEDKLLKARSDGSKAQSLLNDEMLQGAFAYMRNFYAEKLLSTSKEQTADRETLYQMHRLVGEFERHLQNVLNNGKLADVELNDILETRERKKRFGIL